VFTFWSWSSICFTFAAFQSAVFFFLCPFGLCSLSSSFISGRARIFCHQQLLWSDRLSRAPGMLRNTARAKDDDSSILRIANHAAAFAESRFREMPGAHKTSRYVRGAGACE